MKAARYGLALEAWPIILILLASAGWLVAGPRPGAAIIPALLLVIAILKFRDPPRTVPADPLGVLSPVDGRIADIDRGEDGIRILLHVAAFSPYLLRSPTEGKIVASDNGNGGRGMNIRTDEGEEVSLRMHGPRWLPPAATLDYGQRIGQGQRCGLLRSARAAELWLPGDAEVNMKIGDEVVAGESVLGRFHRNGSVQKD